MRKIGYARVVRLIRVFDRQLGPLRAERVDVSFERRPQARASKAGPNWRRPSTSSAPATCWCLPNGTAATRSMFDGIHLIERINARGALIKVLDKPHLDLTTPLGRGFIAFLWAMAEDERHRIVKRANEGRAPPARRAPDSVASPSSPTISRPRR